MVLTWVYTSKDLHHILSLQVFCIRKACDSAYFFLYTVQFGLVLFCWQNLLYKPVQDIMHSPKVKSRVIILVFYTVFSKYGSLPTPCSSSHSRKRAKLEDTSTALAFRNSGRHEGQQLGRRTRLGAARMLHWVAGLGSGVKSVSLLPVLLGKLTLQCNGCHWSCWGFGRGLGWRSLCCSCSLPSCFHFKHFS